MQTPNHGTLASSLGGQTPVSTMRYGDGEAADGGYADFFAFSSSQTLISD